MEKVFVYGTLQRGFHNHALLGDSRFIGAATTAERYVLRSRPGGIPFVGRDLQVSHIVGELFDVDPNLLPRLDQLEGCRIDRPELSWYHRALIDVSCEGAAHRAWIYFNPETREPIVPGGDWARMKQDTIK